MTEKDVRRKIMILADWYEPGYKAGGPIQSVKNFAWSMHETSSIYILTADTDLGETDPYDGIPSNQWIERAPGIRVYYGTRKLLGSARIVELIREVSPDFLYLNSMYSIRFTILPLIALWRKKIDVQVVLSPRGMLRESAIRIKSSRKKLFIRLLNRLHIPQRIWFHATDQQEKKDIQHYFPTAGRVDLIPNFAAALPLQLASIEKDPGFLRCVFIARIMGIKNILFLLELLAKIPLSAQIELSVYGDIEDASYWQKCREQIQLLPAHVRVNYHGSLAHEKVNAALEANHLFVLPTLGENFGHSIFEALSAGRPVLISNKTPWLSLEQKGIGWDLTLDTDRGWLSALESAAGWNQAEFDQFCRSSRDFASKHVRLSDLEAQYQKLFSGASKKGG